MSNEMRKYIGYMKNGKPTKNKILGEEKKDTSMRGMLGIMRKLNENQNIATKIDENGERKKMNDYFKENNVTIDYEELKIYSNGVIFGGDIDGQIQFVYKVTPEEKTSGIEVNYLEGFDAQDPENEEVVKKLESYYDIFYKYWRNQIFE